MGLSGITYRRFPELETEYISRVRSRDLTIIAAQRSSFRRWLFDRLDPRDMIRDFREFRKLPVFYSP